MTFMDLEFEKSVVKINGHDATVDEPVYENFDITIEEKKEPVVEDVDEEETYDVMSDATSVNTPASDKIYVIVNTQVVNLTGKTSYIFVDILDFYPFDTSKSGGREVVMTINGNKASFTDPINDGDIIDLYWK